ncbi:sulfite exporter TauE/SafE family protein, partial [bacterium]|nr:sulfite exporter TauE/SafE family protein [bacterium]
YLPDPRSFKFFVGCVLVYIGSRLAWDVIRKQKKNAGPAPTSFEVKDAVLNFKEIRYSYQNETYRAPTWAVFLLSFIVGIIGGVYGIGGGAIIAPFLIAVFRFQVHSIAGASLFSTLFSSVAGVIFYTLIAPMYAETGLAVTPDWLLGSMFGVGGAAGIYVGARLQKHFPAVVIKGIIAAALLYISINYIAQYFI